MGWKTKHNYDFILRRALGEKTGIICLFLIPCLCLSLLTACTISYKFTGTSINYDQDHSD